MPALSTGQKATLRTHPHKIKMYLAVLQPQEMMRAQISDATVTRGTVTFTVTISTGSAAACLAGMSVWVSDGNDGTQNDGRVRLRSVVSNGSVTVTVAENDDINWTNGWYISVRRIFEFWPMYPRELYDPGTDTITSYKDYNIAFTDQTDDLNPVPVMGPHACAFIDSISGVATVYFDGSDSYCLDDSISTYAWAFESGTPVSSAVATPGNVTWDTAGEYLVSLTVTAANGKTAVGYRHVFIYDRSSNLPTTNFAVKSSRAALSSGGWDWKLEVFEDAGQPEFPDGTLCVLFAEAWYGSTAKAFGMNNAGRHNIRGVGWLVGESVTKDPESSNVLFDVAGLAGKMSASDQFPTTIEYVASSPTTWHEMTTLDSEKALFFYVYWHSTLCLMADFWLPSQLHAGYVWGPFKIQAQDFAGDSVGNVVKKLSEECFFTSGTDRQGGFYVDYNVHMLPTTGYVTVFRNNIPVVIDLTVADIINDIKITREPLATVNFVDFNGVAFDGSTAEPVISYAPGNAPLYFGSARPSQKHVLDPTSFQAKGNVLAGLQLAWGNNEFPRVQFKCNGDYSITDILPRERIQLTLTSTQTWREYSWVSKNFLVSGITERYEPDSGYIQTEFQLESECSGVAGATGDYPPDEPPEPPYEPPPPPSDPDPPPDEGGGWRSAVYVGTKTDGVFYTADFSGPDGGNPTWVTKNGGLGTTAITVGPIGDPWGPADRQFLIAGGDVYRRVPAVSDNWVEVLSNADAVTATGSSSGTILDITGNINKEGYFYVLFNSALTNNGIWLIITDDYGDTWTGYQVTSVLSNYNAGTVEVGALQGTSTYTAGEVIYVAVCAGLGGKNYVFASVNHAASWTANLWNGTSNWRNRVHIDPSDQSVVYAGWNTNGPDLARSVTYGASPVEVDGANQYGITLVTSIESTMFVSVYDGNLLMVAKGGSLHKSIDRGATWTTYVPGHHVNYVSVVQDAATYLYLANMTVSVGDPHVLFVSSDNGTTVYGKCGANADVSGGAGDSIPYDCGGVANRGILQIWTA